MKIIGLMMARNEVWVLPASITAMMRWVDSMQVIDHASTDGTRHALDFLHDLYRERITWSRRLDPEWNEVAIRQDLLDRGRAAGGTHFLIADADEIMTARGIAAIRLEAASMNPGDLLCLPWIHAWRSLDQYRCDNNPRCSYLFRDAPGLAYAADADGYSIHKRAPAGVKRINKWDRTAGLGVIHLQHAVWNRVMWKQCWYSMTEMLRWGSIRAPYAGTVDETGLKLATLPDAWWPAGVKGMIDLEAEPWQEAEVRRLIALHGRERFAGCSLLAKVKHEEEAAKT